MTRGDYYKCLLFAVLIAGCGIHSVRAQQPVKGIPSDDPRTKPIKAKREPNDVLKKWADTDVPYIISEAEKAAYKRLTTDAERENFIANFWGARDPDPDTEENEYREQYYERIAYANGHFASGIPGWRTDRGRIYITSGKPDSIDAHPSGGSYDRPSYEGGGSTSTYPFETWTYRHLDNVGDGIEIEFVDPSGSGEYRLTSDPNEKDAMLHVPGAGQTLAEQMGLASKADRMGGVTGGQQLNFQREQDSPFNKMDILSRMSKAPGPNLAGLDVLARADSGTVLSVNPLQFDLQVDFFRQSDNSVITAFTVQTSNKELKFNPAGSLEEASINILGQVTAVSGKRSAAFEDSVKTDATSSELAEARDRKSVYQRAVALAPGDYKVGVLVRDVATGNRGFVNIGFKVPRYDDRNLSTSSLILASNLRQTNQNDLGKMFIIGNTKVVPNLSGVYKQGQDIGVYLQVYNAQIDQTTLRPAVDVDYVLTKNGKEVLRRSEDWTGLSDSGQRITLARLLPTALVPPGDYEVKVQIRDRVENGKTIEAIGKFTITQ